MNTSDKCRTERFWDSLNDVVEEHFYLSMALAIGIPLGTLCLIPLLA
jgi:hypothetical protein